MRTSIAMKSGVTRWRVQQIPRILLVVFLALIALSWVATLPLTLPFYPPSSTEPLSSRPISISPMESPSWTDTVVIDMAVFEPGVQLRMADLTWNSNGEIHTWRPVWVLADGRVHRYIIPVGTHTAWRGEISDVQLTLRSPAELGMRIVEVQMVRRSPLALDALLLWLLSPLLIFLPPWPNVALLVAALLALVLALAWPWSALRRRLAVAGLIIGIVAGTGTVISQFGLLQRLVTVHAPMNEAQALLTAPSYVEPADINVILQQAAAQLPAGQVAMVSPSSESFLLARARYLLYPRPVTQIPEIPSPEDLNRLLQEGYVGLITPIDTGEPPVVGWQRLESNATSLAVWVAPNAAPPPSPRAFPGQAAGLWLFAALLLLAVVGWTLARCFSSNRLMQIVYAWPLGCMLLAWWMFALNVVGVAWSWLSVGVPLLALAAGAWWYAARHSPSPAFAAAGITWPTRWEWAGATLLLILLACVAVQAWLLPFTDLDTLFIWAFKAQGFFYDGSMVSALTMYGGIDEHHAGYPPAQPLLLTWGYIAMGGISERLVKLVFPLWYAAAVGLLWFATRQWNSRPLALVWTLLLATTPIVLDHATLGNADLPLAVLWMASALALARWIESGERRLLLLGTIVTAGAAWVKVDGFYFGISMLVLAILVRGVALRRQHQPISPVVMDGMTAGSYLFALILPWSLYRTWLGLGGETLGLAVLQFDWQTTLRLALTVMSEQLLFSYANSAWGLLGGGYGILWWVCGIAMIIGAVRRRNDPLFWFLALLVLGGIAFYFGIYLLRPYLSIDRYILHIAPLAILAAARSISNGDNNDA